MNPWLQLALFVVGNLIMVPAILMLAKKVNPVFATALLIVGLTMMLHFGGPTLFSDLRSELGL